ncbi:alpha/beta hydrolase [Flavitalea sp. BT771]|uniref:alpha/beta fold hydrolase n=1 Tax=Flavitalea sp. BT771 TaxID=3063329 RepID=UPI0026E461A7|nr:alpha/beta hydrolase [Flavitalea sp. BT771]MDO6429712.1 alpha/beta hydrolase [Flavitalea sp. BT771]MDV6218160.1 alpha/beta hydrolase [Flavitalea sp. BT771]
MDKTILYQTINLSYKTFTPEGQATSPVILIHGFAEDGSIWDNQVAYLKNTHRLIVPDLPGSGLSSPLPGDTSMESLARAVRAVLEAEQIEDAIMIGHSMGGYVTLAFAELYPGMLKAFGLFHSTAYPDSEEKKAARRKGMDFIRKNGAAAFIRQSTPHLFSGTTRNKHPEWVTSLIDRYAGFNPDALIRYYEAMIHRPDRTHVLQQFPGAVLFIMGEEDSAVPLITSLQQSHMPSMSYIQILENTGHMGMMEDAAKANLFLEEFLNDQYYA